MGFHDPNVTGYTDTANLMDDPDPLFTPSPQEIAALVTAWRRSRNWKQATLAQFAAVSLSPVERIERGETVSIEILDRVAVALEFKEGDFHRPRPRRSVDKSLLQTMRFFEGKLTVPCVPLRTQPQVAALLGCDAYVVDDGRCMPHAAEAIASLRENLGFYRSALREPLGLDEPVKKREIYTSLLADVQAVERRGYTALYATYDADSRFGPVKVAVIAFFPKFTDPGAAKREVVFVPTDLG